MSFTILTGKEGASPKKPLFLVSIVSPDGDTCYLCTSTYYSQQSLTYNGNSYLARIQNAEFQPIQAMSPQGYDTVPSFTLTLADGDKFLWSNHCISHGWRGSAVTLTIILWDVVANQYSTDAIQYSFIGGNPQHNYAQGQTTLDVTGATNFTRLRVPSIPLQYRCPWSFPGTMVQRIAALNDPTSISYECGYSADCGGVGNLIAKTTLSAALTSGATSCTVASASSFPAVPFQATIDSEELSVTHASGTTLTIARAQDGTVAASHLSGASFYVPFTSCDYTRSGPTDPSVGCMARLGNAATTSVAPDGDLTHDIAGNYTARFGGTTWLAPAQYSGRQYVSGQNTFGFNQPNTAIAGQYFNWIYGTQWVTGQVLAPAGEPNSLRSEVVACTAPYGAANVIQVVVNGVIVPQGNTDVLFTWRYVTAGGRNGALNGDAIYGNHGDPHGSQCCIEVVVPAELAAPGSVPSCQILVTGDPTIQCFPIASIASGVVTFTGANTSCAGNPPYTVRIQGNSNPALNGNFELTNWTYGPPGTITLSGTSASGSGGAVFFFAPPDLYDTGGSIVTNPTGSYNNIAGPACNLVWAVLDLMTWGNITLEQIDPVSWYNAAQIAATQVSYTAADGSTQTHAQFKASFSLSGAQRQTLSSVLVALRNAGNLMIAPNSTTGLIQAFIRQTLADQQPATIPGSNDNTAVSSLHADSTTGTGYYAYYFDETVIEKDSFRVTTTSINSTPNTVSVGFQDEYNGYVQDSLTEIDPTAYLYSGNQEIQVPVPLAGAPNFDQLTRVANVQLAEALYGNFRNDPGGTLYFEFMTNHRVLHLASRLGFICGLTWQALGIGVSAPQAVRILSLKPDTDGERWQIKAAWHNDEWYTYAYGQNPAPFQTNPLNSPPNRPPFPWQPNNTFVWPVYDDLYAGGATFSIGVNQPNYPSQIAVKGSLPVNSQPSLNVPTTPIQAATANTGGSLLPGTYFFALVLSDGVGGVSAPSSVITCVVPAGTSTNEITIQNIRYPKGSWTTTVYAGTSPMEMVSQGSPVTSGGNVIGSSNDGYGNWGTLTISDLSLTGTGMPDPVFSKLRIQESTIVHGGVWGDQVTSATGASATFASAAWTTNQWTGYVLSLYYRPSANGSAMPGLNVKVTSNTATTLVLDHSGVILQDDVVVLRAKPSTITSNTIGDANFVNSYAPSGLTVNAESGNHIWITAGTGAGQAPKTINSNTATVLTIDGSWDVTPDGTSVFIVTAPTPFSDTLTQAISQTASAGSRTVAALAPFPASAGSVLIQIATADANGNIFPMQYQPFREVWLPAPTGSLSSGFYTITPAGGQAIVDLTNGLDQRLVLNATGVSIATPIWSGGSLTNGTVLTLHLDQDATGGRVLPTFAGGVNGFASDVQSRMAAAFDETASTSTIAQFVFRDSAWVMKSAPLTGVALS